MRINNNLMAMNTHRQYSINNSNVAKNVEKLSSGYRINRAGDDAAGLAISEKMRAQIRGLNMASKNSQDGISLIQTAEGALQESHNILQRMRELAVQSASDTNETTIDRDALNKEFQAMLDEIDDTAAKTKFNDLGLIDGSFAKYRMTDADGNSLTTVKPAMAIGAAIYSDALAHKAKEPLSAQFIKISYALPGETLVADAGTPPTHNTTFAATASMGTGVGVTFAPDTTSDDAYNELLRGTWTYSLNSDGTVMAKNAATGHTITGTGNVSSIPDGGTVDVVFKGLGKLTFADTAADADTDPNTSLAGKIGALGTDDISLTDTKFAALDNSAGANPMISYTYTDSNGVVKTVDVKLFAGQTRLQLENGVAIDFGQAILPDYSNIDEIFGSSGSDSGSLIIGAGIEKTGIEFIVQTGANKGDELQLNIDKMDSKTLGIFGTDVSRRENASWAIQHVNNAINTVSTQRAALGAMQNRMEHKIANLDTSSENLQAAEARIRDLDMAKEMTAFTKNNILSQASTAMLAQANSLPQGVLQLLQ